MADDLCKRKLAYPFDKGKTIESFYDILKLGRENRIFFYFKTIIS